MSADLPILDDLPEGDLVVHGRHPSASNVVIVAEIRPTAEPPITVAYKPITGERPLWDFPDGSLAAREVAAALLSTLGGFDLIPTTELRDGPLGAGSVQRWVGEVVAPLDSPIAVTAPDAVPQGNLVVLAGEDEGGDPLLLSHPDDHQLRSMAVLDAVLNNSDRKGGHILNHRGRVWGIDHGVSLHADPKVRTVLWGWAGEPLSPQDLHRLTRLQDGLASSWSDRLTGLLTPAEIAALRRRVDELLDHGDHPEPTGEWPAIPWPPM